MTRRWPFLAALAPLLLVLVLAAPAGALEEADRLWLLGERAAADGLHSLARRALERFVVEYPSDSRLSRAFLLLGQARLALGDAESALEAFRRLRVLPPPAGHPLEPRFWEGEALFRLRRFAEARTAYDEVVRGDAAAPKAPDALYGLGWCELELRRPDAAAAAFRELITGFPDHALAPSATFYLARALAEQKRFAEALPLLERFTATHGDHRLRADAQYLLGWARIEAGEARQGIADLRAFLAAHPDHELAPAARRIMLAALTRHGDKEDLQEAYKAVMEQSPATAESLYDAGSLAGRLGRPKEQAAAWRRLTTEFPDHTLAARAAFELASGAFKRKDWKEAAALAQVAMRSEDEAVRVEALLLGGEAELKLRRFASAAKHFEAVSTIKGAEVATRYRALAGLGLAREELKEWRAALTAYEAVAAKSPDTTLRDWARDRAATVKRRLGSAPTPPGNAAKPRTGS
jgi:TolA-binding protein